MKDVNSTSIEADIGNFNSIVQNENNRTLAVANAIGWMFAVMLVLKYANYFLPIGFGLGFRSQLFNFVALVYVVALISLNIKTKPEQLLIGKFRPAGLGIIGVVALNIFDSVFLGGYNFDDPRSIGICIVLVIVGFFFLLPSYEFLKKITTPVASGNLEIDHDQDTTKIKKDLVIAYTIFSVSFVFIITVFAGILYAYFKKDEAKGTWLESHYRWLIRTFWFGVIWTTIAILLSFTVVLIPVAIIIAVIASIWLIYRIVKGWLRLSAQKPMYR